MAETKPFASLSSGLLARKGGAKPAMRPQGFGGFNTGPAHLEDLGWNDMGQSPAPEHVPSSIEGLTPSPVPASAPEPVVVEQQRNLRATFTDAEVVQLPRSRTVASKGKAAFTLRLDPERHLKLRLACALTRRSAQQLVTEALDDFLEAHPEVEALSTKVPAGVAGR